MTFNQTDLHQLFPIVLWQGCPTINYNYKEKASLPFLLGFILTTFLRAKFCQFSYNLQGQSKQNMTQFNLRKQQNQFSINIKSLRDSQGGFSMMTSRPAKPSHALITPGEQQRPFTIRVNINSLPLGHSSFLPAQSVPLEDQKSDYSNRIAESVERLKRGLILYRHSEQDEEMYKLNVLGWFKETQAAFLSCLHKRGYLQSEETAQEEEKDRVTNLLILAQENLHTDFSKNSKSINEALTRQIGQLRHQVEENRRDSIEALIQLQSITKITAGLRSRLETQHKQIEVQKYKGESLMNILNAYVQKSDSIIQKISAKQEAEGKLTTLEQDIRRMLLIVKSNAYVAQAIWQY